MHAAEARRTLHGQFGGHLCRLVQIRKKGLGPAMAHDEPQRVLLAHGGGGQLTSQLIRELILPNLKNEALSSLGDSACLELASKSICLTTDSYVVKPLFFHGGDIGKLAVCGTINDLAVAGSRPVALTLSLIVEEGFEMGLLERILQSIGRTARENHVSIVTGDTKTVERGSADGVFINTAGIGIRLPGVNPGLDRIAVGDKVLINGTIGDHGMAIMSVREGLTFETELVSDSAALHTLVAAMLDVTRDIHCLRDATRGGVAAVLNELAERSQVGFSLDEQAIPVRPAVQAACEMLGMDPLYVANEGKLIAIVPREHAGAVRGARLVGGVQQAQHLQLALGEHLLFGRAHIGGSLHHAAEHLFGDGRVQHRLPCVDSPHGIDQIAAAGVLEQIAGSPRLQDGKDILVIVIRRKDEHRHLGHAGLDPLGRLDAVHAGHTDIQHGHIGPLLLRHGDGLASVAGLGHHAEVLLALQDLARPLAHHHVVICQ